MLASQGLRFEFTVIFIITTVINEHSTPNAAYCSEKLLNVESVIKATQNKPGSYLALRV